MKLNGSTLTGVRMGNGFRDALLAPIELKEFVSNESRLEHGKRVIASSSLAKYAPRTVALEFLVSGSTASEMETNRSALFAVFYNGTVVLEVPEITAQVFRLVYLGKSPTYSSGLSGRACRVMVSFEEPDPSQRQSV